MSNRLSSASLVRNAGVHGRRASIGRQRAVSSSAGKETAKLKAELNELRSVHFEKNVKQGSGASSAEESTRWERAKWALTGAVAEAGMFGLLRWSGIAIGTGIAAGTAYQVTSRDGSVPTTPLEPSHLPKTAVFEEARIPIPTSWSVQDPTDVHVHRVPISRSTPEGNALYGAIEEAMLKSSSTTAGDVHRACLGTNASGQLRTFKVVGVERIENFALWKAYWHRKREMVDSHHAHNVRVQPVAPPTQLPDLAGDGTLDANLNECFLFHGLPPDNIPIIADNGFDERVAALKGGFGAGIYFADQGCKALQYAAKDVQHDGRRAILLNRVTLGDPFYVSGDAWRPDRAIRDARRPPERGGEFAPGLTFDSVVALSVDYTYGHAVFGSEDSETEHREVVIYDHRQAYPEYVVYFHLE